MQILAWNKNMGISKEEYNFRLYFLNRKFWEEEYRARKEQFQLRMQEEAEEIRKRLPEGSIVTIHGNRIEYQSPKDK